MVVFVEGKRRYMLTQKYAVMTPVVGHKAYRVRPEDGSYVSLTRDGYLEIGAGFVWDGPSGPAVDTVSFLRASLVHDAGYWLISLGS